MQVSVIIPCYNVSEFVEQGLRSILKQSYSNLEIVCLDDSSTDGTYEILLKLSRTDSRIKLFRNEINLGLVDTLNKLVSLSNNNLLVRMDPDDIAVSERVALLVKKQTEFNSDIVSSDYSLIDEQGNRIKKRGFDLMVTKLGIVYTSFFNSPIPHSPSLIKKDVLVKNPYKNGFKAAEDYNLWSNLLLNIDFKVNILKDELYLYRMNSSGMSQSNHELQVDNHIRIAKKFVREFLHINSDQMDFWCISKKKYDFLSTNKKLLIKSLSDIFIIHQSFVKQNKLSKEEKIEVDFYTAQYLIYTYVLICKQCWKYYRFSLAFNSVLASIVSNYKILISYKNLKWIIKNI
jgi:glycosyltransferase involved in cell wall biosynthesis